MFTKAERKKVYLKLCIQGPSGSGKTFSALTLAKGFGAKKIAVIDTENGSASLYSHRFDFDSAEMTPPFLTEKYIKAIKAAVDAKYDVLVIDSLSHGWAGQGGILEQKSAKDRRGGNQFQNWDEMTQKHNAFVQEVLQSPIHIICTLRTKVEYIMEENDKGKMVPRKIGLAPIQREGLDYEFTTVLDIGLDHSYEATKDRTGLFEGRIEKITENTGKQFREWLEI